MDNYYKNNLYNESYQSSYSTTNNLQYKENLLKANIGKNISIYLSFPDSIEHRDKIFNGKIQNVGNDHILIKDENNRFILLQTIYINFIVFEDTPLN